jgi:catecholate siderophore receptor
MPRSRTKFTPTIQLRNQTQYSHYTIGARESGPNNVGTVANGVYTPFVATNLGNATSLPLDQLFVGLGSHDRNITDTSLYNQTDLITDFTTGPVRHLLITGLELGQDTNNTQNFSRNIAVPLISASCRWSTRCEPAAGIPAATTNLVQSSATDVAPYNDTMSFAQYWKVVAGVRQTATTRVSRIRRVCPPRRPRASASPACAPA